jgi:hypothetical protein
LDEMLAQAHTEATGSPQLLAQVHLRIVLRANLSEGSPEKAGRPATRAAEHARAANDQAAEAMALTMLARMRRIRGDPEAESVLAQALALAAGPALRDTAKYLAILHAMFDDQLTRAHDALQEILPSTAAAEDRVDIPRGLAEVEVRLGRCPLALEHAGRAISISEQAGLPPARPGTRLPSPSWLAVPPSARRSLRHKRSGPRRRNTIRSIWLAGGALPPATHRHKLCRFWTMLVPSACCHSPVW